MKRLLAVVIALALPGGVGAQFYSGGVPRWGPNGNGTLDHRDDLRWLAFHGASVTADDAKGEYRASFSPELTREDGQRLTITGYMMPIDTPMMTQHFVLTRRSAGCPFCPPNEPTEAIEVFAQRPFAYTGAPVTVAGTLRLVARSEQGLFFRLDGASVS